MSPDDVFIDELIDSKIEELLQDDSYYKMHSTPIKPGKVIKQEHRKQLKELFRLKDLRTQLDRAQNLILHLMPTFVSAEEFVKIKKEIEGGGPHFVQFLESMTEESSEKPILLQEMFGLSNDTLLHAYDLAADLVNKGNVPDALSIFVFLGTMAPYVASYWIAQGVCFQSLKRYEEAVAVFNAAKLLNPSDPVAIAHIVECCVTLKENDIAKHELDALKNVVHALKGEEKQNWEQVIKNFKIS